MPNPDSVTTDILSHHIDYMRNLVGINHVGFGPDYIPDITYTADGIETPGGGHSPDMGAKGVPTPSPRW